MHRPHDGFPKRRIPDWSFQSTTRIYRLQDVVSGFETRGGFSFLNTQLADACLFFFCGLIIFEESSHLNVFAVEIHIVKRKRGRGGRAADGSDTQKSNFATFVILMELRLRPRALEFGATFHAAVPHLAGDFCLRRSRSRGSLTKGERGSRRSLC